MSNDPTSTGLRRKATMAGQVGNAKSASQQSLASVREIIQLYKESAEAEEATREAEEQQRQLEQGLKGELARLRKEHESEMLRIHGTALDEVFNQYRVYKNREKDEMIDKAQDENLLVSIESELSRIRKEKNDKMTTVEEMLEELRGVNASINNEAAFKSALTNIHKRYNNMQLENEKLLMMDEELEHQQFLFVQANKFNGKLSTQISKQKRSSEDEKKEFIRRNSELLDAQSENLAQARQTIAQLTEENMKLKSSLLDGERVVKEMEASLMTA